MDIVVLGGEGTYCDLVAKRYIKENNLIDAHIVYEQSILLMAKRMLSADLGVFPAENALNGFVMDTIFGLVENKFVIIDQEKIDVDFAFVTNADDIKNVKNIFTQFKVYGQCSKFIAENNFVSTTTQSNTETLQKIRESDKSFGAIIPMHLLNENEFHLTKTHIADNLNNQTRFFILKNNRDIREKNGEMFSMSMSSKNEFDIKNVVDILYQYGAKISAVMAQPKKDKLFSNIDFFECEIENLSQCKPNEMFDKLQKNGYKINQYGFYKKI